MCPSLTLATRSPENKKLGNSLREFLVSLCFYNATPFCVWEALALLPNIIMPIYAFWDISLVICGCVFSPWIIRTHVSMYYPWFTPLHAIIKVVLLFRTLINLSVTTTLAMTSQQEGHYNLKNSQHTHTHTHTYIYYIQNAMHFILQYT